MQSLWDSNFVVVDVETTGSDPKKNRMTEIACVQIKGGEVIHEYSSLINPHQFIPPFIARMTGISNEMAFAAPEAREILPLIENMLSVNNSVFVAHNCGFDWSFISESFMREKIHIPAVQTLCSLKLARRLLPKELKKNVGSLANYFNVPLTHRHRAFGDARATASILLEMLEIAETEHHIYSIDELIHFHNQSSTTYKSSNNSNTFLNNKLNNIPEVSGIYYFYDKNNNLLYIGKAKNLKLRVKSYFAYAGTHTKKVSEMVKKIFNLEWVETESELSALLLESKEIKKHKPPYNRADKKYRRFPFIKITNNEFPRAELSYHIADDGAEYYGPFRNAAIVEEIQKIIDRNFKLRKCEDDISPSIDFKPCFYHQIDKCDAPCSLNQTKEEYISEVEKVNTFLYGFSEGIIEELEKSMYENSLQLNFERAAKLRDNVLELKKLFTKHQNIPTSIIRNNLILIIPISKRERLLNILFIKSGKLIYEATHGRLADMQYLANKVKEVYYDNPIYANPLSLEDLDEVRIVSSWLHKQIGKGFIIHLENKSHTIITSELKLAIQNTQFNYLSDEETNYI